MLEVLRSTCPFPTIDDTGELRDGLNVAQPKRCRKCARQSCREHLRNGTPDGVIHKHCDSGYSLLLIPTGFGTLLINGVYVPFHNTAMDANAKKANRSQKVTWEQAVAYAESLESSTEHILGAIRQEVLESVAGLHDIKTAVSLVFRNAEGLIRGLPGYDDHEKIENAEPNLKRLLKSVSLIKSRLDLASLIANPESASYGQPRSTPVYRLFHRMVRLFEEEATRRRLRINMRGESYNNPRLFDSFETLPLVLIDNAVKYGSADTDVNVIVFDLQVSGGCSVLVESTGVVVQPEYRELIFERRFRAPEGKKLVAAGSGLGLYIGQIVARANGSELKYEARDVHGDGSIGKNVFLFTVSDVKET